MSRLKTSLPVLFTVFSVFTSRRKRPQGHCKHLEHAEMHVLKLMDVHRRLRELRHFKRVTDSTHLPLHAAIAALQQTASSSHLRKVIASHRRRSVRAHTAISEQAFKAELQLTGSKAYGRFLASEPVGGVRQFTY